MHSYILVHWYNKFHNKRPVQTSPFVVHGPTRTSLKWSSCGPTISGVSLNQLPHLGVKNQTELDLQTLVTIVVMAIILKSVVTDLMYCGRAQ